MNSKTSITESLRTNKFFLYKEFSMIREVNFTYYLTGAIDIRWILSNRETTVERTNHIIYALIWYKYLLK